MICNIADDYHSRPVFYHPPGHHLDKSAKLLHSLHLQVILPSFHIISLVPYPSIASMPGGAQMVRPMITIIFACVCWLTVPTLFAPYPTWQNLCEVRGVMRGWIMYFNASREESLTSWLFYEFWHLMMICNLLSNMKCIYTYSIIPFMTLEWLSVNLSPLEDVEAFYHFMMRCPADRSRAELYSNRRRVFLGGEIFWGSFSISVWRTRFIMMYQDI